MTTFAFNYYGDDGLEDFTVEVDEAGMVTDSSNEVIKSRAGTKPGGLFGMVKRRYQNQEYEIVEQRTTSKAASQFQELHVGEMETINKDEDRRLVFGWAYVMTDKDGEAIVDKSGEFIDDPDVLEDAAYNFVIKARKSGDSHKRTADASAVIQVGEMVESIVFTPEKCAKMGIPANTMPTGWWVGFRIDNDDSWQDVKKGKKPMFSIYGKAAKQKV